MQTIAGQAGPDYDNLTFRHGEHPLYPADNDFQTIFAHHPEHGDVGRLTYRVQDHPAWTGFESPTVHVTMMHVEPEHRRRGVARQLMDHLEKDVHADTLVDHGKREPDGVEWAKNHYNDPKADEFLGKSWYTKNGRPWNLETGKYYRMRRQTALNDPASREELVRNAEGKQDLYRHSEMSPYHPGLCGAHAEQAEREHQTTFSDLGVHLEGEQRPEERRWFSAGKGSCPDCTRFQKERIGELPGGPRQRLDGPKQAPYRDHRRQLSDLGDFTPLRQSLNAFVPHLRVFTATCGLDHRLWDADRKLRPEIRKVILQKFTAFCANHGYREWSKWAKIVFFGSEASEWTSETLVGNGDFDLSIGVEYNEFRRLNPEYSALADQEIADMFTQQMHAELNDPNQMYWVKL